MPPGYALATVFVNGIPSEASIINIGNAPVATSLTITGAKILANGSLQFVFTNSPGGLFSVLGTTNLFLSASSWTVLSGVFEVSPGQFQFTDPEATNGVPRFYRARSP